MDQGSGASEVTNISDGVIALEHDAKVQEILQDQHRIEKKLRKRDRETIKYTYEELDQLMKEWLNNAEAQQQLHHSDNALSKRVGRGALAFFNSCHGYLKALSGVVQLMEGLSQGYGTAAYAALSIFVVVAVSKKETETEIDTMLETLRREYTKIERLSPIYANRSMHSHVSNVYHLGLRSLQDAARYYRFKSYMRCWATQDSIRLTSVEAKVKENLECQVGGIFNNTRKLEPFDFKGKLERDGFYQAWDTDITSSFLVIRGETVAPESTRLSWASPAATGVIRLHSKPKQSPSNTGLIFYRRQDADIDLRVPMRRVSPTTVMSALIYQLLCTKNAKVILNDDQHFEKLRLNVIQAETANNDDRRSRLFKLYSVLSDLLKNLSFNRIYLILDRPNCLSDSSTVLKLLLDLIEACPTGLKILIVGREIDADFLSDSRERRRFHERVFNQHD
ncbi:hypothetical protein MAC_08485 [Metarhizium acridum CQMa 102]|uniref:DUF7708 domain-containing protein n=1 Tax=Metarhizium acridum (strain CQMa 102) TaxID=655827 RepID=E9EF37_METAQ|nr:uncharacterized protein MAC_08485 [Metarhizium acridum CQMa 102]EFY85482.1 hypothetical protein MAC_08485 [Metarhizium acridum CQMa 102]